ncbi:DUF3077 domain-containing protein [Pseudomonas sp. TE3610]
MDKLTPVSPAATLQSLLTASCAFGAHDESGEPLFQVRAGVDAETALSQVALLLKCAHETAYELTDNGCENPGLVWSVVQSLESAQALVDSVLKGTPRLA